LLRRHGLYSSHLVEWRKAQQAGALAGLSGLPRPVKRPPSRALGHRQAADAVIDSALTELEPELGIVRACGLLGRSRATRYRKLKPAVERTQQPRASPPSALTAAVREQVLGVLRSSEHGDREPDVELDRGVQHCSAVEGAVGPDRELPGGAGMADPADRLGQEALRPPGRRRPLRRSAGTSVPARSGRRSPAAGGSRDPPGGALV